MYAMLCSRIPKTNDVHLYPSVLFDTHSHARRTLSTMKIK